MTHSIGADLFSRIIHKLIETIDLGPNYDIRHAPHTN